MFPAGGMVQACPVGIENGAEDGSGDVRRMTDEPEYTCKARERFLQSRFRDHVPGFSGRNYRDMQFHKRIRVLRLLAFCFTCPGDLADLSGTCTLLQSGLQGAHGSNLAE